MIAVSIDQLDDVAAMVPESPTGATRPPSNTRPPTTTDRDRNLKRFRAYLAKIPVSVWGQNGNDATYKVACCARDFDLNEADARTEIGPWSRGGVPPWPEDELQKVIAHAYKYAKGSAGSKLTEDRPGWHKASDPIVAETESDAGLVGNAPTQPDTSGEPHTERPPRWQRAADVIAEPIPEPVIEGVASENELTVLAGESAAGKTFVMLDAAAAVSGGLSWHGRQVQEGSAVCFQFEGHVGLRLRAQQEVGRHRLSNVYVIRAGDPLSPTIDRDRVELPGRGEQDAIRDLKQIAAHIAEHNLPPIKLVTVDTVRASLSGSEDSSEAVSAYLRAVRRIMRHAPGAACLLLHHAGWQDGEAKRKRERGSSAFRGNVDGTLYLEAGEYDRESRQARLTLTSVKMRDGEKMPPLHLVRQQVEIPGLADRWCQPITSCLIVSDSRTREDREAEQAAEVDAEARAFDLKVLRVIAERPDLTSQEAIRLTLGLGRRAVYDAIGRLVAAGFILPPTRQRQPYTPTPPGQTALTEAKQ